LHQDFEVRAAYTFGTLGSSSPSDDDVSYYAICTDLYQPQELQAANDLHRSAAAQ
jgi:hypothetical protein